MAIYRLYPEKDTTIWSEPTLTGQFGNAGKDEIVEIGTYKDLNGIHRKKRVLVQFRESDITNVINNKTNGTYKAKLHYYLANASGVDKNFEINAYKITGSWDEGVGKKDDQPYSHNDCNWKNSTTAISWSNAGGDYNTSSLSGSQHFTLSNPLDINMDITSIVESTNGYILKVDDSVETNITSSYDLRFFGKDTNTIFPPYLEFSWDDQILLEDLPELDTTVMTLSLKNNEPEYKDQGNVRFRLSVRPKYPTRSFVTSSIYLKEYRLPSESYWAVIDDYSNEPIVDFGEHTKISADSKSAYFDLDMSFLHPQRFYKVLIKTTLDGSTLIVDNESTFKVVRHG